MDKSPLPFASKRNMDNTRRRIAYWSAISDGKLLGTNCGIFAGKIEQSCEEPMDLACAASDTAAVLSAGGRADSEAGATEAGGTNSRGSIDISE
jgi:hypothetical protein